MMANSNITVFPLPVGAKRIVSMEQRRYHQSCTTYDLEIAQTSAIDEQQYLTMFSLE